MPPTEKPATPEREQTDESLRVERERADDALGEKLAALEQTADAIIAKARAQADDVLAAARAQTDRHTRTSNLRSTARVRVERAREDDTLREERADADEEVRSERAEHCALLSTERTETDNDLQTERTRADDAVATRDEFLGIVGHDLRDLLTSMIGSAALITLAEAETKGKHADKVITLAERITRSGYRMKRLIGDLVDVASIEAGVLGVVREVGDPTAVVMEAVDTFQTQASAKGISLTVKFVPPPTLLAFDPARILQVLTNLLSNAIKFAPTGGEVHIGVERIGQELRFAVHDTGAGIPADQLDAVFERFRQVTPNDRRGVGMGLYISKCIVQGHGGRIWAESRPGQGSTSCFTLPVGVGG